MEEEKSKARPVAGVSAEAAGYIRLEKGHKRQRVLGSQRAALGVIMFKVNFISPGHSIQDLLNNQHYLCMHVYECAHAVAYVWGSKKNVSQLSPAMPCIPRDQTPLPLSFLSSPKQVLLRGHSG